MIPGVSPGLHGPGLTGPHGEGDAFLLATEKQPQGVARLQSDVSADNDVDGAGAPDHLVNALVGGLLPMVAFQSGGQIYCTCEYDGHRELGILLVPLIDQFTQFVQFFLA